MQHFMTGADPGAATPIPGPVGEIRAHVALVPMLRVGPYLAHEIALFSGAPAREITSAGLRAKLTPPLLALPWRTWALLGVGYARAYEPSHTLTGPGDPMPFVPGEGGGSLDLRVGVGLGYRVEKTLELFMELAGQFGVFFTGSMYDRDACSCSEPFQGKDSFALSLSLGLSLYP
jgi:hypothetical protein